MTDEQMRIKIAEACGWKPDKRGLGWLSSHGCYDPLPDYLNDLNACSEFEATLTREEQFKYQDALIEAHKFGHTTPVGFAFIITTSTPLQRAAAFLKTKGLIP